MKSNGGMHVSGQSVSTDNDKDDNLVFFVPYISTGRKGGNGKLYAMKRRTAMSWTPPPAGFDRYKRKVGGGGEEGVGSNFSCTGFCCLYINITYSDQESVNTFLTLIDK